MSRDIAVHGDDQAIAALAAMDQAIAAAGGDGRKRCFAMDCTYRIHDVECPASHYIAHSTQLRISSCHVMAKNTTNSNSATFSLPINASSQLHNSAVLCCDLGIQNAH